MVISCKCTKEGGDVLADKEIITSIFNPIVEYVGLIIKDSKIDMDANLSELQVNYIYHIIPKLHEIVILKCKKRNIEISDADTLMVYMDYLCDMITNNLVTSNLYPIMSKINRYFSENSSYISDYDIELQRWNIFYSIMSKKSSN